MTIEEAYRGIVSLLNLSGEDPQHVLKSVEEVVRAQEDRAAQRFFNKVQKKPNGCWDWTSTSKQIRIGRHLVVAGRYSWFLRHGEFPPKGFYIRRNCSNVHCVNPDHLRLWRFCATRVVEDMSAIKPIS